MSLALQLGDQARAFARTPPREKAALLRATLPRMLEVAPEMVTRTCRARGLPIGTPAGTPAWLAGPVPALAYARQLADALEDIASRGRPSLPASSLRTCADGRIEARLSPRTWAERAAQGPREVWVLFAAGAGPEEVFAGQAASYREAEPEGGVSLIVGRGPDGGILDALFALFVEGKVAVIEAQASSARLVELALAPLAARGFVRVVVDTLGEEATVEAPLPGDVFPVLVAPCLYGRDELDFQARGLASQLAVEDALGHAHRRVLVLPCCWPQRRLFLERLAQARRAYFPPTREPLFGTESSPGWFFEAQIACDQDPVAFFAAATAVCNDDLPGSRCVQIMVHPLHEEDPVIAEALHTAIGHLRYGAVGVNEWPLRLQWEAAPPWRAHPSGGFRNNARMLAGVDKAVVHAPLLGRPPVYFQDRRDGWRVAEAMASFHAAPRVRGVWGIAGA